MEHLRGRERRIDLLNEYLRNELSAVDVYALAIESLDRLGLRALLEDCRRSHEQRAESLRQHIAAHGGEPSAAPGTWEVIAPSGANGPEGARRSVGIAALEEFEYQDLRRYREEMVQLDDESRTLLRTKVLPEQELSYRSVKAIRNGIG